MIIVLKWGYCYFESLRKLVKLHLFLIKEYNLCLCNHRLTPKTTQFVNFLVKQFLKYQSLSLTLEPDHSD